MSIWSTKFSVNVEARDNYGHALTDHRPSDDEPLRINESCVYVSTSPNMSNVIRLTITAGRHDHAVEAESLITPDEARRIAAALIEAAEQYDH